jgi:hypothetical membrane protein
VRNWVRPLAWAAIGGQVAFVISWIVAGAIEPGYSGTRQTVSELGGTFVRHAWVINAGFIVLAMSLVALLPGLLELLPRRRAALLTSGLFAVGALAFLLLVPYRLECSLSVDSGCSARFHAGSLDWQTYAHMWDSLAARIALGLTPFAVAWALWPRPVAAPALALGVVGLIIAVVASAFYSIDGAQDGLVERLELLSLNLWVVIVAVGLLHETRRPAPLPAPTPLRPRDFFGSRWTGQGRLLVWPRPLTRRLPLAFSVSRELVAVSDDLWIVEDRATFAGGHVERRRMFCELVEPTRVRVTADELPDGAEVLIGEEGFRILPYRVHVPLGPLRIPLSCRDESMLEKDGTLVNTVTGRLFGVPVIQLIATARPEPDTPHPAPETRDPVYG